MPWVYLLLVRSLALAPGVLLSSDSVPLTCPSVFRLVFEHFPTFWCRQVLQAGLCHFLPSRLSEEPWFSLVRWF